MIDEIRRFWWWVGIQPVDIICENDFGNLLITDVDGKFWRLCPEELSCEIIAQNRNALDALNQRQEFLCDWYMQPLVEKAATALGPLPVGGKYCMKMPSVLGGEYDQSNFAIVLFSKLIRFSGWLAKKIKDLPGGTEVKFQPIA